MNRYHAARAATLAATLLAVGLAGAPAHAKSPPFWTTPAIEGYGKIHYLPSAAYKPSPAATYKVVFAVSAAAQKPGEVNWALEHVAKAVNLYVAAGVPLSHLKFVAIVYGPATPLALDDAHYQQIFHVANPNLDLIAKLRKAGVDVAVCGQAVAVYRYDDSWIDRHVTLALSALTTVTVLEQQGYALMQF